MMSNDRKTTSLPVSIQNYVRLAAREAETLRDIGEESIQKATHKLSSKRIDQIIKVAAKETPAMKIPSASAVLKL
jgi:hypothetical protein